MIIKKPVLLSLSLAVFIILLIIAASAMKISRLNNEIIQAKALIRKVSSEAERLQADKDKILGENKKLQADTVSYINLNTKLQDEKEKLQKAVSDAQKVIETKESSLQRAEKRLSEINKALGRTKSGERNTLIKEKKRLIKKMTLLNETLKKERSLYHYNLGVAYANAKLYDDAVEEYKKSLSVDPENADAYYNMALIYQTVYANYEDAAKNYVQYLKLRPKAEDREEILSTLNKLHG